MTLCNAKEQRKLIFDRIHSLKFRLLYSSATVGKSLDVIKVINGRIERHLPYNRIRSTRAILIIVNFQINHHKGRVESQKADRVIVWVLKVLLLMIELCTELYSLIYSPYLSLSQKVLLKKRHFLHVNEFVDFICYTGLG